MAPAPTPSPRQAAAPPANFQTPARTPQSRQRLHFAANPRNGNPSPNPMSAATKDPAVPTEHPVEVVGRIRDYPDRKDRSSSSSALEVSQDGRSVRVRTDTGYRDFGLDGVSLSDGEDLQGFYKRFVESRVAGVRQGAKCTIMMYGPTGSGKSHTMFGCSRQPGIVYRALKDILGDGGGDDDGGFGIGLFVQVAVLEIYNEEIYDLLSANPSGSGLPKGNNPKVRLEVMGKKAKNATYISGNEAEKISKEVAKVEKRRIVKSTLCNERSSRSHCLIILDVPAVCGRLMLVDMAGSENIEQAGQLGFEAKLQTAKINQGNTALKRVVECIANGDSHVPFRDSKLTMLLQDSFEDDKSKILMILCASPDPREMHKIMSTLEYGAKAKCIVRVAHISTPQERSNDGESAVLLRSRIVALNQFIHKLQLDNKLKEKEHDEANKAVALKEEELRNLKDRLKAIEGNRSETVTEEAIKLKVDERTNYLTGELARMEAKMLQQEEELYSLRRRLEEMESNKAQEDNSKEEALQDICGGRFMRRLVEVYEEGDQGMEKSMELDFGDQPVVHDVREIGEDDRLQQQGNTQNCSSWNNNSELKVPGYPDKFYLSTVYEGEDEGDEDDMESTKGDEVDKEVVEENTGQSFHKTDNFAMAEAERDLLKDDHSSSDRISRIQNIFRLCGNYRELAQHVKHHTPSKKIDEELSATGSPAHPDSSMLAAAFASPPRFGDTEPKSTRTAKKASATETKRQTHIPLGSLENTLSGVLGSPTTAANVVVRVV